MQKDAGETWKIWWDALSRELYAKLQFEQLNVCITEFKIELSWLAKHLTLMLFLSWYFNKADRYCLSLLFTAFVIMWKTVCPGWHLNIFSPDVNNLGQHKQSRSSGNTWFTLVEVRGSAEVKQKLRLI